MLQNMKVVRDLVRRSDPQTNGLAEFVKYSLRSRNRSRRKKLPRVQAERVLGIASTGHGASLSYLDASGTIRSSQLERWTGTKHMLLFSKDEDKDLRTPKSEIDKGINYLFKLGYGEFPPSRIFEETIDPWREWLIPELGTDPIDLVITSDGHFATGWARLGPRLQRWFPDGAIVRQIEHHEIHQRQAFWASGFDEAAVLTLDSAGDTLPRRRFRKLAGTLSVMSRDGRWRRVREWFFPEMSSGALYDATTIHVGFRQGEEGKTMGLSAYGSPELFETLRPHLRLHADGGFSFMDLADYGAALTRYTPPRQPREEIRQRDMDVACTGQLLVEQIVANAWRAALEMTGQRKLAYAGGVALNSVANGRAWNAVRPDSVYIPPNAGDPGHSLGCALFGAYEVAGWHPPREELSEYLGPAYDDAAIASALTAQGLPLHRAPDLEATIAACVANGHIVARFDGGAEFGPRALGNRSILADPRRPGMKHYLNARVKHREPFRPFAPTVLEDHASEWFEMDSRSDYMLRVVAIRADRLDAIPAVAHVDGTARVQTLCAESNLGFWRIVSAFHELTGVPLVLNTSFNLAGKPIVETPEQAVDCFTKTEIDVLAIGPFVVSKQPLETYLTTSSGA